jgi:hypothetical protein
LTHYMRFNSTILLVCLDFWELGRFFQTQIARLAIN